MCIVSALAHKYTHYLGTNFEVFIKDMQRGRNLFSLSDQEINITVPQTIRLFFSFSFLFFLCLSNVG